MQLPTEIISLIFSFQNKYIYFVKPKTIICTLELKKVINCKYRNFKGLITLNNYYIIFVLNIKNSELQKYFVFDFPVLSSSGFPIYFRVVDYKNRKTIETYLSNDLQTWIHV